MRISRTSALVLCLLAVGVGLSAQQTVTVAWDPSPTANVSYQVYRDGTLVGTTSSLTFAIPVPSSPHTFAVASALAGVESVPIALTWAAPGQPPQASPTCTIVTSPAGRLTQVVGSTVTVWSFGTQAQPQILRSINGATPVWVAGGLGTRLQIVIVGTAQTVNTFGIDGNWYRFTGTTWSNLGSAQPACGTVPPPPTPLTISCPANQSATTTGSSALVSFPPATTQGGTAPVAVQVSHASGSSFPVGPTRVTATGRDAGTPQQTATCGFDVVVTATTTPPSASCIDVTVRTASGATTVGVSAPRPCP